MSHGPEFIFLKMAGFINIGLRMRVLASGLNLVFAKIKEKIIKCTNF